MKQAREFRPDIQALRAIAVTAVVVFHLWPATLGGGYVGVDVFFVVSGFLITSHLLREAQRSGTVNLPAFWMRRIRRLQPAALLVLLCTALGIVLWVPRGQWLGWLGEVVASALWMQNWLLGWHAVDYLAAHDAPSPVQHYWSLSGEEQFYLLFPLVLLAGIRLARRWGLPPARTALGVLLVVAGASFVWSLWQTYFSPSMAYFSTLTRAWEFAAGALLAAGCGPVRPRWRQPAVLAGVALIGSSAVLLGSDTAFPGSAALLPVAGTMLCLWAGQGSWLERLGGSSPVAFLGRCSYAIYLWHWPLLVLAPWALMHAPFSLAAPYMGERGQPIVVALACLLLGWLTTRLVEDPIRFSSRWAGLPPRRQAHVWLVALAMVLTAGFVPMQMEQARQRIVAQHVAELESLSIDQLPPCLGAGARVNGGRGCHAQTPEALRVPDLAMVGEQKWLGSGCFVHYESDPLALCHYGPESGYTRRLLIAGDSHLGQFIEIYGYLAERNNWRIDFTGMSTCYFTSARKNARCVAWQDFVRHVARENRYDAYLFSHSRSSSYIAREQDKTMPQTIVNGLVGAWNTLPPAPILALVDNPGTGPGRSIVQCYLQHQSDPRLSACDLDRAKAMPFDGSREAAAQLSNVKVIDLTDFYCDDTKCPAVIGNVIVYRDDNHITRTWAKTLAPHLNRAIVAALEEYDAQTDKP